MVLASGRQVGFSLISLIVFDKLTAKVYAFIANAHARMALNEPLDFVLAFPTKGTVMTLIAHKLIYLGLAFVILT